MTGQTGLPVAPSRSDGQRRHVLDVPWAPYWPSVGSICPPARSTAWSPRNPSG